MSADDCLMHDRERHYVGFRARFLAFLLDSLAAMIPLTVLAALVLPTVDLSSVDLNDPNSMQALLRTLLARLTFDLLVLAVLVVACWIRFAATPGKMVVRAAIVDATTLEPVSPARLVVRYLGYFPGILALGVGFLWIAFDRRKQGWHDKLAGTVVVRIPSARERRARIGREAH